MRRRLVSFTTYCRLCSHMRLTALANLVAFLKEIDVPTRPVRSPFALSRDDGSDEWAGSSPFGVFTPLKNIGDPERWKMLLDALRFYYFAPDELRPKWFDWPEETIGKYLHRKKYTQPFGENCLFPMLASLWSFSSDVSPLRIPAKSIIRLVRKHCLLDFLGLNLEWLTIDGSAEQVADTVLQGFDPRRIHYNSEVTAIRPTTFSGVYLFVNGDRKWFDHAILAVPGDKAYEMWASRDNPDTNLDFLAVCKARLSYFVLHSDTDVSCSCKNSIISLIPQH
jgi:predicted NAD/FAD-binding protein